MREQLLLLQLRLEAGEIEEEEYVEQEAVIMARLREVRQWREKLGKSVAGGPVRVARGDEEAG